jgi:hypothetical protein
MSNYADNRAEKKEKDKKRGRAWYTVRINTSIAEKEQATCLQGGLVLFGYESVTNTEKTEGF